MNGSRPLRTATDGGPVRSRGDELIWTSPDARTGVYGSRGPVPVPRQIAGSVAAFAWLLRVPLRGIQTLGMDMPDTRYARSGAVHRDVVGTGTLVPHDLLTWTG